MKVGTEYWGKLTEYKNGKNRTVMSSFSDIMNQLEANAKQDEMARDTYTKSIDYSELSVYTREVYTREKKPQEPKQELKLPMESERYKITDDSYIEGVPAYGIVDKMTGKSLYLREDRLAIQKDEKTGLEFLITPDPSPFSSNVMVTNELKDMIYELAEKRNVEVQEMPLQGGLTVNNDPKTGLDYLTIRGEEGRGASIIIRTEQDIEKINKVVDEFLQYPVSSERGTAELYAVLEISGNLKREENGFTLLNPNGISYVPYDSADGAWWIKITPAQYSVAREYLAWGTDCTILDTWNKILQG